MDAEPDQGYDVVVVIHQSAQSPEEAVRFVGDWLDNETDAGHAARVLPSGGGHVSRRATITTTGGDITEHALIVAIAIDPADGLLTVEYRVPASPRQHGILVGDVKSIVWEDE